MIYGAIAGDVIGSRFEFDRGGKTKDFDLFTSECTYTDDTVMTIAVADALHIVELLIGDAITERDIKNTVTMYMRLYGRYFPNAGYGQKFIKWLFSDDPKPYGSFGNGSAMRTSSVGWMYNSIEKTMEVARWVAEVSHNHPEGIKGAECTSAVIYLARNGADKDFIRKFVEANFDYDISKSVDELRPHHEHIETCMDSLPKALVSFFEGNSYEDVIRNAVSLGGDTDTLGAIAGAMAEAMYGVPDEITECCDIVLPTMLRNTVHRLENKYLTK